MQLTRDYLISEGFETNHPEYVLCKMYKHSKSNPEWRVSIEENYIPFSNKLAFDIDCWKCDESGTIVKRASVHFAETSEELESVIKLCNIDVQH